MTPNDVACITGVVFSRFLASPSRVSSAPRSLASRLPSLSEMKAKK